MYIQRKRWLKHLTFNKLHCPILLITLVSWRFWYVSQTTVVELAHSILVYAWSYWHQSPHKGLQHDWLNFGSGRQILCCTQSGINQKWQPILRNSNILLASKAVAWPRINERAKHYTVGLHAIHGDIICNILTQNYTLDHVYTWPCQWCSPFSVTVTGNPHSTN